MNESFSKDMNVPLRVGRKGFLAKLRYTSEDPHAVTLAIPDGTDNWVFWEFHRDLLRDGLSGPAGKGDIRIGPGGPTRLRIHVTSGKADMTFDCAAALIRQFAARIFEAVPAGREHEWIDFDREINELLEQQA